MRKVLLSTVLVIGVAGCQSGCAVWDAVTGQGSQETTVKAFEAACTTYKNVFQGINLADQIHPLTPAQVRKVNDIDLVVENICPPKGKMPTSAMDGVFTILTKIDDLTAAVK